jgi:DNA-binding transcriptional LysR family regulator
MPHNIDTALLRAFLAVAETGGMTSAARLLNLTQAAVSQQVKRLEDAFGRQLFERDRRGLRLTPRAASGSWSGRGVSWHSTTRSGRS